MEDTKNTDKKENESLELKEKLTDEELSGLSGGHKHVHPLPGNEELTEDELSGISGGENIKEGENADVLKV